MSGLKETWEDSHSVPAAPPGTSHPTPYPQPLQPRGWASLPFPSFSDSFITQPFWFPVILVPGLSLFLSHRTPTSPLMTWFSLLAVSSLDSSRGLYNKPSPVPHRGGVVTASVFHSNSRSGNQKFICRVES